MRNDNLFVNLVSVLLAAVFLVVIVSGFLVERDARMVRNAALIIGGALALLVLVAWLRAARRGAMSDTLATRDASYALTGSNNAAMPGSGSRSATNAGRAGSTANLSAGALGKTSASARTLPPDVRRVVAQMNKLQQEKEPAE